MLFIERLKYMTRLLFKSSQLRQKFKFYIVLECAGLTYSDPIGGIITSPNYPSSYSNNLVCSYLIDLRSSADFIYLRFLDVNIQTRYDYITVGYCIKKTLISVRIHFFKKIYDGPTVDDVPLSNVSGSDIPGGLEGLRSRSGQMLITFTTDSSFSNYNGFLATYSNGASTGDKLLYTSESISLIFIVYYYIRMWEDLYRRDRKHYAHLSCRFLRQPGLPVQN